MEATAAERTFNSSAAKCNSCHNEYPNYRMGVDHLNQTICYQCLTSNKQTLLTIKSSYKHSFQQFITNLPIPDYSEALACLKNAELIRAKAQEIFQSIRKQIDLFDYQLNQYLDETKIICEKYIEKLKKYENRMEENYWLKKDELKINQEKYILNIRQKHKIMNNIEVSLSDFQTSFPSVEEIKKRSLQNHNKESYCPNISIVSALNIRGSLFVGTADGRIIYQKGIDKKSVKAHQALIRALQYDNQYLLFSGGDDFQIKAWDLHGDEIKCIKVFGNAENTKSYHRQLSVFNFGKMLASSRGQFDGYKIRIWELENFNNTKTLEGHEAYIKGMVMVNENELASVSDDRYLKVWDLRSWRCSRTYFHGRKLNNVFANSETKMLCLIDQDNKLVLLDDSTMEVISGLNIGKKIYYSSAGKYIYVNVSCSVFVFDWAAVKIYTLDVGIHFAATNILEMGNQLILTDAFGTVFKYLCDFLK